MDACNLDAVVSDAAKFLVMTAAGSDELQQDMMAMGGCATDGARGSAYYSPLPSPSASCDPDADEEGTSGGTARKDGDFSPSVVAQKTAFFSQVSWCC